MTDQTVKTDTITINRTSTEDRTTAMYRSVLDQDRAPVVLCDTAHTVVYMNPAAVSRYAEQGGAALVGRSLLECHSKRSAAVIEQVLSWFSESRAHNRIYTYRNDEENKDVYMIALRDGEGRLIGYYEKHEYRNRETAALYGFSDPLL